MKSVRDKLVKEISKEDGIDPRVVRLIADCPIKFYRTVAADDDDIRPVRIRYVGVFAPKSKYIKEYEDNLIAKESEVIEVS